MNGLQTTRAVVQGSCGNCFVLTKIVKTEKHWEIARAANFQNQINRIDLDLAEYIRPATIREAASQAGIGFQYDQDGADSIFAVLEAIYQDRITYQEVRSFFVGLFSRDPNNTIDPDYGELRTDLIEQLYERDGGGAVFAVLFNIQRLAHRAAEKVQEIFAGPEYAALFQRFWEEPKTRYRAFLTLLAACGSVRWNLYESKSGPSYSDMRSFLNEVNAVVEQQPDVFVRYYRHAFKAVAHRILNDGGERNITLQTMTRVMHRAKFSALYRQLCVSADDDDELRKQPKKPRSASHRP